MPLDSYIPVIDNRQYADIVAEARTRIERYTPEWTDVNDNEPGMALVQLLAWMTDLLIYRLGQVPALNYLKFLELIGIELNPAQSATAEITFPVVPTISAPYVIVPLHTQVSAQSSDGTTPIVFETERAFYALTAALASVLVFDGYIFTDRTQANQNLQSSFQPFGAAPQAGAALMLGFQYSGPFPQVEVNLDFWTSAAQPTPAMTNCGLPDTQAFPSAQLAWEYWSGSEWDTLTLLKDETVALQRSGHVYLKTPPPGSLQPGTFGAVATPLYWIRARIAGGSYEQPPAILAVRTNTMTATQATTVTAEVLGGSDGSPNQTFTLTNTPVLAGTLQLQVNETGTDFETWTEVTDFFGSDANAQVYALDRTTGEIRFGDGVNGAIPLANVDNPTGNIVAQTYRYGGGEVGNVPAGALSTMQTSVTGVDESKVTNLFAASGGSDEETLADAQERAPQALKTRCRAVTADDFQTLAQQAANIARANTLPLTNPNFPGVSVPGSITVVVVPNTRDPNPMPTSATLRTVCAYLNQRRLLTCELYVVPPTYQLVEIQASVIADNSADLAEVTTAITNTLLTYLHPLTGGSDGTGWPFGGTIYYSALFQQIFSTSGVSRVETMTIVLDGIAYPMCQDVPIKPGALVYSTEHQVQMNYDFSS
jgi:predicted phage baseplate assembly protein